MTKSMTLLGIPGQRYVMHPELVHVTILGVKREGIGHTESDVLPIGMEFNYVPAFGRILFDNDIRFYRPTGTGGGSGSFGPLVRLFEKIWILYKT